MSRSPHLALYTSLPIQTLFFSASTLVCSLASAQPQEGDGSVSGQNAAVVAPPPAPGAEVELSESGSLPPEAGWKKSMRRYELGQPDVALAELREQAITCGAQGAPQCEDSERAAIFMCVGIVLSGGAENHTGGVQAFKKALVIEPRSAVSPEYTVPLVMAAFQEAQGKDASAPAAVASTPAPTKAPGSGEPNQMTWDDYSQNIGSEGSDSSKGRIWMYGAFGGKFGVLSSSFDSIGVGQVGGTATVAGMPGESSRFTIGVRLRGGALVESAALGYMGASALLGGTLGSRMDNNYGFILGGVGIESYPALGEPGGVAHFIAGVSLSGLVMAFGVDLGVVPGGNYALFGAEIGYGGLL